MTHSKNLIYKKILFAILTIAFSSSLFGAPSYQTTTDACYKNREIVYPLQEVFDALKQTLMQSNLNIVTVTKDDGILTAKGSTFDEEEETIISVTMTVDFKERINGITSVKVIASYETQERQSDSGQLGGAGISLPIPVPFTGKYTLVGSGNIDDSLWYQGFFSSLEKILFENYMKYSTVDKVVVKAETKEVIEIETKEVEEKSSTDTTEETPKAE
ncbi:MAG: hypothetical protein DRG78_04350 [Epsilonproteobacteria bacterium]|nr:MAG: hypothetical protein DRG78_04350 [Campylobacterota bacterium]